MLALECPVAVRPFPSLLSLVSFADHPLPIRSNNSENNVVPLVILDTLIFRIWIKCIGKISVHPLIYLGMVVLYPTCHSRTFCVSYYDFPTYFHLLLTTSAYSGSLCQIHNLPAVLFQVTQLFGLST